MYTKELKASLNRVNPVLNKDIIHFFTFLPSFYKFYEYLDEYRWNIGYS